VREGQRLQQLLPEMSAAHQILQPVDAHAACLEDAGLLGELQHSLWSFALLLENVRLHLKVYKIASHIIYLKNE